MPSGIDKYRLDVNDTGTMAISGSDRNSIVRMAIALLSQPG